MTTRHVDTPSLLFEVDRNEHGRLTLSAEDPDESGRIARFDISSSFSTENGRGAGPFFTMQTGLTSILS